MVDVRTLDFMPEGDEPFPVTDLITTKLYDNNSQIWVAAQLIAWMNMLVKRQENHHEDYDVMRGALVATTKFAVQTFYENNKRQFTLEHKAKIMEFISAILDTQLNQMNYAQVLAH